MNDSLAKVRNSVRAIGVFPTLSRAVRYCRFVISRRHVTRRTKEIIAAPSIEERFTRIFETNYWGDSESASGSGSNLAYTQALRLTLPTLFERFRIRRVFDAPCGDFNWMQHVLRECSVEYVGADIVAPLIDRLSRECAKTDVRFVHLDITVGPFPDADLWFCRDCLFHLSYADIRKALVVFISSGTPYLMTTTHLNPNGVFINTDIRSGDFRRIDLFAPPFNFPRKVLASVDDWCTPQPPRQMCLWSREQIVTALERW